MLERKGKDAQTAVADYLRELWIHVQKVLARRWMFMSSTSVQVVLTVPAIWSDAAKDATLAAARRAGMGDNIMLVSEPEAAALYALPKKYCARKASHRVFETRVTNYHAAMLESGYSISGRRRRRSSHARGPAAYSNLYPSQQRNILGIDTKDRLTEISFLTSVYSS